MIGRAAMVAWLCVVVSVWTPSGVVAAPPIPCEAPARTSKALARACEAMIEREVPEGDSPADYRRHALDERARIKANRTPNATERWVGIGPTPIVGGRPEYVRLARPRSGRVAAIAIDPSDQSHWLIGAAGGGVWESRDGGTTWAPRTDDQAGMAMGAIAFAPSDPRIVYAGTGERVYSVDAYGGVGVLKSSDGGRSWVHLQASESTFRGNAFSVVAVHPMNPDVVMAAVTKSPFSPPQSVRGIFKSLDGGATWAAVLEGEASDLEIHSRDFKNQYAALGYFKGTTGSGVYRSLDEGKRWRPVNGPWAEAGLVGRVELALSPSHPDVLYVSVQDASPENRGGLLGLWRTRNAWAGDPSWETIPVGQTDDGSGRYGYCGWRPNPDQGPRKQCWYNHELSVDPTNPNILYAGGIGLWRYAGGQWQEVAFSSADYATHADQHRMAWAGARLVVGNDGGLWSTTTGGPPWGEHNTGLSTLLLYGGTVAPIPGFLILGGTQDTGTAVWAGMGPEWTAVVRGDSGPAAISTTRPGTHWAIEGLAEGLEVWRTSDGGTTLQLAATGLPLEVRRSGEIVHPLVQCPTNDEVLLLGDMALWKTTNFFASAPGQPTWTRNSDTQAKNVKSATFAAADAGCNTYAFASAGAYRLTTNSGVSWRNLDPSGRLSTSRVPRGLAFDPRTPNTLFVVLSGFNDPNHPEWNGHVFRTGNALADSPTWQNVTTPVNMPHNAIALDPVDPTTVWVATDIGVFRGQWDDVNQKMSWEPYGPETGLPNVIVTGIRVHADSRRPIAFTHGRGVFVLVDFATWCGGANLPTLGSNFGACPR